MYRLTILLKILIYCGMAVSLLNGCSATSLQQKTKTAASSQAQETLTPEQKANLAVEEGNFEDAVNRYAELLQNDEHPDEARLLYGLALNRTGRYQEAITQLERHMEADPRGSNSLLALNEIARAKASLSRQQELAAEAAAREAAKTTAATELAAELSVNWQALEAQLINRPEAITEPLTGMELILVTGGCFQMGNLFGDGYENEYPVHEVCVDDFYLGKYEVTQGQFQQIMGYNPSTFQKGDDYPVETLYWQEAVDFAKTLSGTSGRYRLPTEAEWEYAARSGGNKERYSGSEDVDAVAWYEDNSGDTPHPVGKKQANKLGLHDMSGNVFEWCSDYYAADYYQRSPKQNPQGPATGEDRIRRGGSWSNDAKFSRTSERRRGGHSVRNHRTGFRLALPAQ